MTLIAVGLLNLPVELLYEIQLFALSENLPLVSHRFYDVFKNATSFFRAKYIFGRILSVSSHATVSDVYTKALRYPMCNERELEALHILTKDFPRNKSPVQLARRFFRPLDVPGSGWTDDSHPLPLLRYVFDNPNIPPINPNVNKGYALVRAVHAKSIPLIQFLLDHGASPKCHENLAVVVAIRQKNLKLVKLLVERRDPQKRAGKKRKLEDRMTLDAGLLKVAVQAGASDIVDYIYREKEVIPDVQTLKRMASA
ncbi:hypothetical protein BDN70DRAFT_681478 [Pholiota conissans]|uniref:Uncharacterized protein n=1 Tax=Pholiota conissans TaxID=109636 RepID=A0A9P6D708_9AGAR|nr:hypothetical protein BDN70DRAFT_681478 [Pholiota conissans]